MFYFLCVVYFYWITIFLIGPITEDLLFIFGAYYVTKKLERGDIEGSR